MDLKFWKTTSSSEKTTKNNQNWQNHTNKNESLRTDITPSQYFENILNQKSMRAYRKSGLGFNNISEEARTAVKENRLFESRTATGFCRSSFRSSIFYQHQNPDGTIGGFVELTAKVSPDCILDKEVWVLGKSSIFNSKLKGKTSINCCKVKNCAIKDSKLEHTTASKDASRILLSSRKQNLPALP